MMQNNNKLVSIGLPTYNRAKYLKRALDVLLAQTYTNFELIISDNCSSDETQSVCEEYARRDARIRYIRQRENIGLTNNFMFVFNEALGDYFMLAGDDDWWDPSFVARLKIALDANPACAVAMSSFLRVLPDGQIQDKLIFKGLNDFTKLDYGQAFFKIIYPGRPFQYFNCGLVRIEFMRKFWFRQPRCQRADRVICGEMALATHFYSLPDILYKKTIQKGVTKERYSNEYKKTYFPSLAMAHYIYNVGRRIVFSPVVPLRNKLTHFLPYYARFILRRCYKTTRLLV